MLSATRVSTEFSDAARAARGRWLAISIASWLWLGSGACGQHSALDSSSKSASTHHDDATSAAGARPESGAKSSGSADAASDGQSAAGAESDAHSSGGAGAESEAQTGAGKGSAAASAAGTGAKPDAEVFRISQLLLRDPHLFFGGSDLTDQSSLGVSVNADLIPGGLSMDYDNDGFIDVSVVARLESDRLYLVDAHCKPSSPNQCSKHPSPGLDVDWPLAQVDSGTCLTLRSSSSYKPPIDVPATPCSVTQGGRDVAMTLGGVPIAMTDTTVALRRNGQKLEGLITGFVTLQKAQDALLPSYVPLLAGSPLAKYLHEADRDNAQSPSGEDGYWFYTNFVAEPARYTE
jgi:hypothetical protein